MDWSLSLQSTTMKLQEIPSCELEARKLTGTLLFQTVAREDGRRLRPIQDGPEPGAEAFPQFGLGEPTYGGSPVSFMRQNVPCDAVTVAR